MSNFKYYCGGEAEQFSFFRIPRALIHDKRFQDLTTEAKLLYALMLDRMGLSLQSGWLDENNRVFIYYTVREVEETLSCGHNKAVRLLAELEQFGLIERVKQGQGRPTKIYIKNFITADSDKCDKEAEAEVEKSDLKEFETETCGVPVPKPLDCPKGERNYTERNDTECSDTDLSIYPQPLSLPNRSQGQPGPDRMDWMDGFKEQVKFNIEYDRLLRERPCDAEIIDGYVELMMDACRGSKATVRICRDEIPVAMVRKRFLMLTYEHIRYVLGCLNNTTTRVANVRAYTLAALYNAPLTMEQFFTMQAGYDMACGN